MRFAGTAWHYARFRPSYPPELFELLRVRCGLDPASRVLDLGTGTGQLALPLAELVGEVVAVDPEPAMLAELRERAPANVRAVEARAEDVGPELGTFALATVGRAFHWLERDLVLRRLHPFVAAVAVVGDGVSDEEPWASVARSARRYVGDRRPRHSGETWTEVLARSPYGEVEQHAFPVERRWGADDVVGWAFSLSWASPALLGDRAEEFERDLRARLDELGGGPWVEQALFELFLARS